MKDSDFIKFQDDFYDLLEKYGVENIDGDHKDFDKICDKRNDVADFIDKLKEMKKIDDKTGFLVTGRGV